MIVTFVRANRQFCQRCTPGHYRESNVNAMYIKVGTMLLAQSSVRNILDAGAGKQWRFPVDYKERFNLHVIGVDIDPAEMQSNQALDEKCVSDVSKSIPVPPGSLDLITAYSGLEHFEDTERFLGQCYLALRPGGRFMAQFPGRFAPFAILNRLLPNAASRAVLKYCIPGSEGKLGFRAFYDRTHYSAFVRLARKSGFDVEYHLPGFFSSGYFAFCAPLYFLSLLFDLLRYAIGIRNLASYNLFVLVKPVPRESILYG